MTLQISARAQNTPASSVRKFVPLADAAKRRGIKIYHINIGQPDLPTPRVILDSYRSFDRKVVEYAPSKGLSETIEAWGEFYRTKGLNYTKDEIMVTAGGAEGLQLAFFAVADPGEELLVIEPFYTSYSVVAAMGNISIVPVPTYFDSGFHLPSKKEIEKRITPKTRAIVICNPNNPTGTLFSEEEIKMISEVAIKHNLFIISDETYQDIVFDGKTAFPLAKLPEISQNLIIVDSVSKRFNACGARIGCLVSKNKDIMQTALRFGQGRLSVATVDQLAVCKILKNPLAYMKEVSAIYEKRRDTVTEYFKKSKNISFSRPQGAFYLILKLPIDDSEKFTQFLLNDFNDNGETVMVAPASGFYATPGRGQSEIRIAYVLKESKLIRAIDLLQKGLKEYLSKLTK